MYLSVVHCYLDRCSYRWCIATFTGVVIGGVLLPLQVYLSVVHCYLDRCSYRWCIVTLTGVVIGVIISLHQQESIITVTCVAPNHIVTLSTATWRCVTFIQIYNKSAVLNFVLLDPYIMYMDGSKRLSNQIKWHCK